MKKILLFIPIFLCFFAVNGQDCIDLLILNTNTQNGNSTDTVFCKIMSEDELNYTIDNGFAITSISKKSVETALPCVREMNAYEVYKFKGIDNVTMDYFQNTNTAGAYLRKSAVNTYLSAGLGVVGVTGIVLGVTAFKGSRSQNYWIAGGGIFGAASIFFMIVAWNQVYKAGKLLDLNSRTALYLNSSDGNNIGISLKF